MIERAVAIDIDAELACWRRPDAAAVSGLAYLFHEWEPAIRIGIHAYLAYPTQDFDAIRPAMARAYLRVRGRSRIPWSLAAPVAQRVWRQLHDGRMRGHGDDAGVDWATGSTSGNADVLAPLCDSERLLLVEA